MYRIVLPLPFDILWVWQDTFVSSIDAQNFIDESLSQFSGMEVWSQEQVDSSSLRKVYTAGK